MPSVQEAATRHLVHIASRTVQEVQDRAVRDRAGEESASRILGLRLRGDMAIRRSSKGAHEEEAEGMKLAVDHDHIRVWQDNRKTGKLCKNCGKLRSGFDFAHKRDKRDLTIRIWGDCKECRRSKTPEQRNGKNTWLAFLKAELKRRGFEPGEKTGYSDAANRAIDDIRKMFAEWKDDD